MNARKKVLAIVPHPDDAEFYAGGLIAKLISEKAEVSILIATDGRCGSYHKDPDSIAQIRMKEAQAAGKILGAEVIFLGYHDYELVAVPSLDLRERLVRKIREFQPEIAIAEDAYAQDEVHPDHRALAWAAADAIHFAQLPNIFPQHLQDGLAPHFVIDKYFYSDDSRRWNKVINISEFFETKMSAMKAHQSQVEFLVEDVFMQASLSGINLDNDIIAKNINPVDALETAMRSTASEIGKLINVEYAEGYRFNRFHPYVESLIENNPIHKS